MSDITDDTPQYASVGVGSDGTVWVAYASSSPISHLNVTWYDGSWHNDEIYQGELADVGNAAGDPPFSLIVVGSVPHLFFATKENSGTEGTLYHAYRPANSWITETVWHGSLVDNSGVPANSVFVDFVNSTFYIVCQV